MTKFRVFLSAVLLAIVATFGVTRMEAFQRAELILYPVTSVGAVRVIGTASHGAMVDLAGYASAQVLVSVGHSVDTVATRYVVLRDSNAGADSALVDSVALDSVDNVQRQIQYRGNKRYVGCSVRGVGGTDTTFVACTVLRGNRRTR